MKTQQRQQLFNIAAHLQNKLLESGFIIHRYNAISTNSIYLKLDYGVANSIRISDHRGKEKLHYKYSIIAGLKSSYIDNHGEYMRFYYSPSDIQIMLDEITRAKAFKISRFGETSYKEKMLEFREQAKNSKGFWQQASRILNNGKQVYELFNEGVKI
jgi:hypothetical protein